MPSTSRITIDLGALDANLKAWRGALEPGCGVCAVVKADAYGLGAVKIARRLVSAGVSFLAVYSMEQAAELVRAGIHCDLLVLMPVDSVDRGDVLYRAAVDGRLHLAVHSADQLERIDAAARQFGIRIGVHVEVNTGMSRCGMPIEEADRVLGEIDRRRFVRLAGLFTHTAGPDTDPAYTHQQHERFEGLLARHADLLRRAEATVHFAGTLAALRDPAYHRSMVRLGLGLYGYGVESMKGETRTDPPPRLSPLVRWTSSIVHTLRVPAGSPVGYHGRYITERDSRLALVPVGHADGYPMSLSDRGVVRIGPELRPAPVRGQVNMDQIIIDVTGLPGADVGAEVELIADDPDAPNALPKLADLAGSSCYEMLCRLSPRLPRRYLSPRPISPRPTHAAAVS